jgi:hypothetical protein
VSLTAGGCSVVAGGATAARQPPSKRKVNQALDLAAQFAQTPPSTDYAALIANAMKAAGVGAQPPATPPPPAAVQAAPVTYTPVSAQVNRSTDTAAGQIQSLLAEGSPVLNRARSLAEQRANGRGLINSSISAQNLSKPQ